MIAPSMSVPLRRDSERRSQPSAVSVGARVREQVVARVAQRLADALQDLRAERLEVRHEHADDPGRARAHAARDEARLVAELRDDREHAVDRLAGDAVAAVDGLRDGRHRDAGRSGDIHDGRASVHDLESITD